MSARVIIERKVMKGKENEALSILRELRIAAMHRKGYFCGETMRARDDPSTFVVLGIWQQPEDWERWQNNPERRKLVGELEKLLVRPEKVSVYLSVSF